MPFESHHATQYKALSDDMRFYADQRFKIISTFLIASALMGNIVKDNINPVLCLFGAALAYLCLSWEMRTTQWWGTLITQCQELEQLAIQEGKMIKGYLRYTEQNPQSSMQRAIRHPKPSYSVAAIYVASGLIWLGFALFQCYQLAQPDYTKSKKCVCYANCKDA